VSFEARLGQVLAIIGPNGAGKTTLFNMISGLLPADEGEFWLNGNQVSNLPAYRVAELGVARTFQNVKLFGNMTVLENVMMGRYRHEKSGFFQSVLGLTGQEERQTRSIGRQRLKRVGLLEKADLLASNLPLGEQRLVELARALAAEPCLLLLDEPTAGLNNVEKIRLTATIGRIRANNVTILLVEHDMNLVMSIADWILVLNFGEKIAEGIPEEIQVNPQVMAAYLGQKNEYDQSERFDHGTETISPN
jgi:ABC-type branched-subunit amino acid transport system ATPase component